MIPTTILPATVNRQERVNSRDVTAVITPNIYLFKSLSNWALNLAVRCSHACRCCVVPSAANLNKCSTHGIKTSPLRAPVKCGGRRTGVVGVKPTFVDLFKLRLRGLLNALIPVAIIICCAGSLPAEEPRNGAANLHALDLNRAAVSGEEPMPSTVFRIPTNNEESRNLVRETIASRLLLSNADDNPGDNSTRRADTAKPAHNSKSGYREYANQILLRLASIVSTIPAPVRVFILVILFREFVQPLFCLSCEHRCSRDTEGTRGKRK